MTCSTVFAILGLIVGILNVINGFLPLARSAPFLIPLLSFNDLLTNPSWNSPVYNSLSLVVLFWFSIGINVVWIIPDIFLLVGISKKKPGFMMVWLVVKMIELVVS